MNYLPLILFVLKSMGVLALSEHELPPAQSAHVVAVAIGIAAMNADPLYKDDDDRHKTAALLAVMAFRESRWRSGIAGDCHGMDPGDEKCSIKTANSLGAFQQEVPMGRKIEGKTREEFLADPYAQAHVAIEGLRASFKACKEFPIAFYAFGRDPKIACANEHSQKISNARMAQARWLRAKTESAQMAVVAVE